MKTILACLLLVAATQAVDWAHVRPVFRLRPTRLPIPMNSGRIIGGSLATEGQFKYQVGIFMDSNYFCGGSLISDSVVLTAAHCVDGYRSWEVHCGALNIRNEQEPGRKIVTTTDAKRHENYDSYWLTSDIGVVRLGQSVSGPNIATIRLPSRSMASELFEGETCRVSGWGRISDSNPYISDDLKFVDLDVISNAECRAYYGNSVDAGTLCVGTNGGTQGTCNGDSGGPLVFTESDGEVTEVGVVSYVASAGCEFGAPAGFARVTTFLDWIEANAGVTIRP